MSLSSSIIEKIKENENALRVGTVSFFNDISGEMFKAILPIIIVGIAGKTGVGIVAFLIPFFMGLTSMLTGVLYEKTGKGKKFLYLGYGLPAITKLLFLLPLSPTLIYVLSPLERIGKAIRKPVRNAIIAATTKDRRFAFAFQKFCDRLGAFIGISLVLFLSKVLSISQLILLSSLFGFLSVVFISKIRERKIENGGKKNNPIEAIKRNKKKFFFAALLFLSTLSYLYYLIGAKDVFESSFFYLLILLGSLISQMLLAKRETLTIALISSIMANVLSSFSAFPELSAFLFGFSFYSLEVEANILFRKEREKGIAYGFLSALFSLIRSLGNLIAGILLLFSLPPYLFAILCAIFALLLKKALLQK